MQCIKCGATLRKNAQLADFECLICGSIFIERKNLQNTPLTLYLPENIFDSTGLHCPIDNSELRLAKLEGLSIEICPSCKRLWFEKGELERFGKKYGKKADVPLWKKHQRQNGDGLSEPWATVDWLIECVFQAIKFG